MSQLEVLKKDREYSPESMLYTPKHTWASITPEGNIRVGITEHARKQLKEIAYVLTDPIGKDITQMEPFGIAETWVSVFDLYAPVTGKIVKVNEELNDKINVAMINVYENAWIVEIEPDSTILEQELISLLSFIEYEKIMIGGEKMNENVEKYLKVLADKIAKDVMEQISEGKQLAIVINKYLEEEKEHFKDKTFFSEKHTWVKITPEWNGKIGLTDYALKQLKDLVKIYTNKIGDPIRILEPFGVAETWMLMFDLYSPIAGKIVAINEKALESVETIDSDTWLIEVHPLSHTALVKELELLMNQEAYASHTKDRKSASTKLEMD